MLRALVKRPRTWFMSYPMTRRAVSFLFWFFIVYRFPSSIEFFFITRHLNQNSECDSHLFYSTKYHKNSNVISRSWSQSDSRRWVSWRGWWWPNFVPNVRDGGRGTGGVKSFRKGRVYRIPFYNENIIKL